MPTQGGDKARVSLAGQEARDDVGPSADETAPGEKVRVERSISQRSHPSTILRTTSECGGGQGGGGGGGGDKVYREKLGHRRVRDDGEVTYKKFETTQLIGSIQLGIQHAVGGLANVPDRDLLMQDFMSIDTVLFSRDGLLQKTPAHNYSEFKFRTYASFAFRRFRKLFHIETDLFLASICSEPMIELSNPGVSGSIFYVTSDDNFICKTVQHKESDFLQKISLGYYLNLEQNQRTLLPKFFGLYCYSCNAKNVRLAVMNNLFPRELKMHRKFDLKGSTYKRKASRQERAKASPTFKDLDFLEMYPEGILMQNDIYQSLMNSIQRDCIVLESFKIMDFSLLIGIHNLDLATRETRDGEAAAQSADGGDAGSGFFDRQGSIVHRERMIAHSTALESITMVGGGGGDSSATGASENVNYNPSGGGVGGRVLSETDGGGIDNVWGGIPAKNHRGENLLLFIGIIDILQSFGMLKKVEHYWKSLLHDGDTVSVHRPGFYASRFQSFMKEKVFKKQPAPSAAVKPPPAFRRTNFRRTTSSSEYNQAAEAAAQDGPPVRGGGVKDGTVTVITIDNSGAAVNMSEEVFLPPVLQDRKPRTISGSGAQNGSAFLAGDDGGEVRNDVGEEDKPSSDLVENSTRAAAVPSPSSTMQRSLLQRSFDERNVETGSIITMTSDERVQIFVPSPSGGGTPYSTITKTSNQEFTRNLTPSTSSPRPPSSSVSWNETFNNSPLHQKSPRGSSAGFARLFHAEQQATISAAEVGSPSVTANGDGRITKTVQISVNGSSMDVTSSFVSNDSLETQPLSLSDIHLVGD